MIAGLMCGVAVGGGAALVCVPSTRLCVRRHTSRAVSQLRGLAQERANRLHACDLAIVGWTSTDLVVRQLFGAVIGMVVTVILSSLLFGGFTVLLALGAGLVTGVLLPLARLRAIAKQRRRSVVHAFSAYLDLVNVLLAGGAGVETALTAAAQAGDGWVFATLRGSLERARLARRSPWHELRALGARWAIPEMVEVAGSMTLSGEHGARIRSSLASRADSMRTRQVAEIEALAQSATERMGIPVMMLFVGFMVLLGYPALSQVVSNM